MAQLPMSGSASSIAVGQLLELLGVVGVGVEPVRRPGRVRAGREGLDALRDGLGLERLQVARVVAVVEEQQVGLVVSAFSKLSVCQYGKSGSGFVRVDHVQAPALEVEQLRRVLRHGDGVARRRTG